MYHGYIWELNISQQKALSINWKTISTEQIFDNVLLQNIQYEKYYQIILLKRLCIVMLSSNFCLQLWSNCIKAIKLGRFYIHVLLYLTPLCLRNLTQIVFRSCSIVLKRFHSIDFKRSHIIVLKGSCSNCVSENFRC